MKIGIYAMVFILTESDSVTTAQLRWDAEATVAAVMRKGEQ